MALMVTTALVIILMQPMSESTLQKKDSIYFLQGENASFIFLSEYRHQHNFTAVFLRSTAHGFLCVMNSSDPLQLCQSEQTDRMVLDSQWFILKNVSLSDSGEYVTDRWVKGTIKDKRLYSLFVCQEKCDVRIQTKAEYSKGDLLIKKTNESLATRVVIEKVDYDLSEMGYKTYPVLNTSLPVEGLPEGHTGIVNISSNSTTVWISTTIHHDAFYGFVVWSGEQCSCKNWISLSWALKLKDLDNRSLYFLKPHDRLSIPCHGFSEHAEQVKWETPGKELSIDVSPYLNMSIEEEEDIYIETRNDSLVITSLEVKHAGRYKCTPDFMNLKNRAHEVFVCPELKASTVLFSVGGAAALVCGAELNVTRATCSFYHHAGAEQEHLTLDPKEMEAMKNESMDRGTMSSSQFFLTMSNLTFNDSGLYYCRMWGYAEDDTLFCFDKKIYLLPKHPFGIQSTFYKVYSALMGCGLLGMICAVISVHLKIRGREQHSQERQGRTTEQPGLPRGKRKAMGGRSASDDVSTIEDRVLE